MSYKQMIKKFLQKTPFWGEMWRQRDAYRERVRELEKVVTKATCQEDYLTTYRWLRGVDKEKLRGRAEVFVTRAGQNKNQRSPRLVVSLTSFPERMEDLPLGLYSLFRQTLKPDLIILWLAKEQFPHLEKDLPETIMQYKKIGLQICWTKNMKAYTKIIPVLQKFSQDIIVTADDDIFYPPNWLELLYDSYLTQPNCIHAHRVHRVILDQQNQPLPYTKWQQCVSDQSLSFLNFPTGVGGVLFPPGATQRKMLSEKQNWRLAPLADDVWIWVMALLSGTRVRVVANNIAQPIYLTPQNEFAPNNRNCLSRLNVDGKQNDRQLKKLLRHYRIDLGKYFDSGNYWEQRYRSGGNSGAGSYGRLAEFKATVINDFVREQRIKTVIEFGVGDGNQLSLLELPQYLGFDVSACVIATTMAKFAKQKKYQFLQLKQFAHQRAELVLSLDVIYHLIEDDVYQQYLANLFRAAQKFVIIYASNKNQNHAQHVRHRRFSDTIKKQYPAWQLMEKIANPYPFDPANPNQTSFSDFYIYGRKTNS